MNKQRFIQHEEIQAVAEDMRATLEVSPLSHRRKVELATEYATERFGFTPRQSVILLAVKLANATWEGTKSSTLQHLHNS